MISILDLGLDVLAYSVDGKVHSADIERVFQELDVRLAAGQPFSVYAEVVSIPGITLPALLKDIKGAAQRVNTLGRLEKAALVTDNQWLRMAVPFDDKVIRGVQVRVFRMKDREAAKVWIRSRASGGADGAS
jgi:hypothetical protein